VHVADSAVGLTRLLPIALHAIPVSLPPAISHQWVTMTPFNVGNAKQLQQTLQHRSGQQQQDHQHVQLQDPTPTKH
jgi:hypothetical protein